MKQHFRLHTLEDFKECTNAILEKFQSQVKPSNVTISDDAETRSHAQNRLYWLWLSQLSKHTGEDKEELHLYFKRLFLAKIFIADGTDDRLTQSIQSLKTIKQLANEQDYELIARQVAHGMIEILTPVRTFLRSGLTVLQKESPRFSEGRKSSTRHIINHTQ